MIWRRSTRPWSGSERPFSWLFLSVLPSATRWSSLPGKSIACWNRPGYSNGRRHIPKQNRRLAKPSDRGRSGEKLKLLLAQAGISHSLGLMKGLMKSIVDSIGPAWHEQFKTSVLANAATFSLVAADTTDVTNDNTDYNAKVTNQVTTTNTAKQATADLGTSRTTAEKHARALVKRIKAHPAYTAAFGNLLGIVGPEDTTDISTLKPEITGEAKKGGVVEIDFNLANSEGVNMNPESFRGYSRRNGDTDFKFLACRADLPRRNQMEAGVSRRRADLR